MCEVDLVEIIQSLVLLIAGQQVPALGRSFEGCGSRSIYLGGRICRLGLFPAIGGAERIYPLWKPPATLSGTTPTDRSNALAAQLLLRYRQPDYRHSPHLHLWR